MKTKSSTATPSPAAPCPSASHLPLVPPSGVTDAPAAMGWGGAYAAKPAAPASPSLPETDLLEALAMSAVLARDSLNGPERKQTAIELNAQLSVIIPSYATLKADVERLTVALTAIAGMDPYLGEAMQDVAQEALLSLAEVGKH